MTRLAARQILFVGGAMLKGVVELWALRRARGRYGARTRPADWDVTRGIRGPS